MGLLMTLIDFTSGKGNENLLVLLQGPHALPWGGGGGGMLHGKIFEFQKSGTAISCDLRVKFMRREAKNYVIGRKLPLSTLPKFIGKQLCKFSGGRINATEWANRILGIYTLIAYIVKKGPGSNSSCKNYVGLKVIG